MLNEDESRVETMKNRRPEKLKRNKATGIEAVAKILGRNEKTGKRVAAIAGKILRELAKWKCPDDGDVLAARPPFRDFDDLIVQVCSVADIKAIAASVLTQAHDREKKR